MSFFFLAQSIHPSELPKTCDLPENNLFYYSWKNVHSHNIFQIIYSKFLVTAIVAQYCDG